MTSLTAVLADDEQKIREGLKRLIDWDSRGIRIIGEAANGDELLDICRKEHPDIALVDMRMPGLSGAELTRTLGSRYPGMKVIIVSGFDDFEYTRQGISSKIVDYILKPVKREHLAAAVDSATKEINEEASRSPVDIPARQLKDEEDFNAVLEGKTHRLPSQLSTETSVSIAVAVINRIDIRIPLEFMSHDEQLFESIRAIVLSESNETRMSAFRDFRAGDQLILALDSISDPDFLGSLILNLQRNLNLRLSIGLGRAYSGASGIRKSFNEAMTALGQTETGARVPVVAFSDELRQPDTGFGDRETLVDRLGVSLDSRDENIVIKSLEETFASQCLGSPVLLSDLRRLNAEIVSVFNKRCLATDHDPEIHRAVHTLEYRTSHQTGMDASVKEFSEFVRENSQALLRFDSRGRRDPIIEVRHFLDNHYADRVGLSELSERFKLSQVYLSSRFKDRFGITITRYQNRLRVNHSKALIAEGQLKFSAIAEELGFSDESHFSKVFKQYEGISPRAFRKSLVQSTQG